MFCASVAYPRVENARFDFDYFAYKHAPLFAKLLGDNCIKYEVHKSLQTPGAPTPTHVAVAYFWVKSGDQFGRTLAEHGQEIYADITNFTDLQPTREWSEIVLRS